MKTNLFQYILTLTAIRYVAILVVLISMLPCAAQMVINGKISDNQTGQPLPFANIGIRNMFYMTTSDTQGDFTLEIKRKAKLTLVVTYMGYEPFEQSLELTSDTTLHIRLEPKAIMTDEVVISGIRIDDKTPMSYANISREMIEQRNLGQDVPYLLQLTPSLVVTSDAGNGIGYSAMRIRGTDISRINVTINGIPFNDPESQSVYWVDVPDLASSVESIQVQRGAGTSTNGAGSFGASININSLNVVHQPYGEIQASAGSFNTFKNSVKFGTGLIGKRWSFDGRLSKISSDGYIDRATSGLSSFFTSATMVDKKNLLKINIFSGLEKTYQSWNGVPSGLLESNRTFNPSGLYLDQNGDTTFYKNEIDHYQQDNFQVLYARGLKNETSVNLALHYTHGKGYYENYKMYQTFASYGLDNPVIGPDTLKRTDLVRQKWLDNHFYGLTFNFQTHIDSWLELKTGGAVNQYQGNHYGKIPWAAYASTIPMDYKWYENEGHKSDFNIFSKINFYFKKSVIVYLDLQYRHVDYLINGIHDNLTDISQHHFFNFFNPKAGMMFNQQGKFKYYLSLSVANREPTRNDFRDADKNNLPEPERLLNTEVGSTYQHGKLAIQANLYRMNYKDQLILTGKINNVGDPVMINVPESYRMGIELSGKYTAASWLLLEMSSTISRNKAVNFTEYVDNWSPPYQQIENNLGETDLAFSPAFTGYGTAMVKLLRNLSATWISRYVGQQYIDNSSSESRMLDAYWVNDLSLVYRMETGIIPVIEMNLMINNIFSEKYEANAWIYRYYEEGKECYMDGYFPQAPVNFLAGVKLKF